MPLTREKFIVYVQDENEEVTQHEVTVTHQDMVRAEVEVRRLNLPPGADLNLATAHVWAALTRTGQYSKAFAIFRDMECMGLEDGGQETVDPTHPVPTSGSV